MDITLRVPLCNIIACEDIKQEEDNKMYICSPFTAALSGMVKRFYTYTIIQGIPNGMATFKIQLLNSQGKLIKETDESSVLVEENIIRAKTKWQNINFTKSGEYLLYVLIKCNNEYDVVGSSCIYII